MKTLKYTTLALVAIFAAALLAGAAGIPVGFMADTIRTQVAADTGYQLHIAGGAKLRIWPTPSIAVRDITLLKTGNDTAQSQLTVESARLDVSLSSLFDGQPKITEFVLVHPVLRVPMQRWSKERQAVASAQTSAANSTPKRNPKIGRVVVEDGTILLLRSGDHIENRIDHIHLAAGLSETDRPSAKIDAKFGSQAVHIEIKGNAPIETVSKSLPIEFTIEAPGLLKDALFSTAHVIASGHLLKINDLEGAIGKDRFTGWASVDLANKPQVKVDLDFKSLYLAAKPAVSNDDARPSNLGEPWSDQKIDLEDLNFVDAQIAFSAADFKVSTLQLAPVYIEAALVNGILNLGISNTGIYGGKGDGVFTLDASAAVPRQTINMNLSGVRALPLLSSLADFRELDGTMQGKIAVQAEGATQRAIMSSLGGSVDVSFRDGQIRNMNLAQMARNLTLKMQDGWQEDKTQKTDLSELSALFQIDAGRATTENLRILGPLIRVNGAGTADIAAKTLRFKLDTRLVMSLEGQGGAPDPIGFGVPVMVEGKWDAPRIYPDMAGILENPDAAYAKLRDLGVGLFGNSTDKSGNGSGSMLQGLGNLFGGQGNERKDIQAPAAGDKSSQPEEAKPKINDFLKNIFGR